MVVKSGSKIDKDVHVAVVVDDGVVDSADSTGGVVEGDAKPIDVDVSKAHCPIAVEIKSGVEGHVNDIVLCMAITVFVHDIVMGKSTAMIMAVKDGAEAICSEALMVDDVTVMFVFAMAVPENLHEVIGMSGGEGNAVTNVIKMSMGCVVVVGEPLPLACDVWGNVAVIVIN